MNTEQSEFKTYRYNSIYCFCSLLGRQRVVPLSQNHRNARYHTYDMRQTEFDCKLEYELEHVCA